MAALCCIGSKKSVHPTTDAEVNSLLQEGAYLHVVSQIVSTGKYYLTPKEITVTPLQQKKERLALSVDTPGPILKGWTRNPRRVYAAMRPTAMLVFPTPLHVPATTMVLILSSLMLLPSSFALTRSSQTLASRVKPFN